ncbi:hypothetical protein [Asanoa iriomotensis]|uniref:Uncharacterized protein n=1 Tax=Asanoa iriomotensis TaxID=234613 RepID=A0ABQ4C1M9_9ACTN|nr:hypothetical protein [Asanoa iriomotensis]GIF56693.1 hypothetical protein Air01nite_27880 [Asanoa iriomotensis]
MDAPQTEQDKRRADVRAAMNVMDSPVGLGLTVDFEDTYLLSDAIRCYINTADAGTIFCVHASCERDLAAMVQASGFAPAGSQRWGLGALVAYCEHHEQMPPDLLDNLRILNDHRKTLYHYGHSESDNALRRRTSDLIQEVGSSKLREDFKEQRGFEGDNKEVYVFAMDRVLQRNALAALTTGFMLRSWLGVQQR